MMTGRITYGFGAFGRLGQASDNPEPVATSLAPLSVNLAQSSIAQNPPAQWGAGEWAVVIGGAFVLMSVYGTGKRGVRSVQGYRLQRRRRLQAQHEAAADYYKS